MHVSLHWIVHGCMNKDFRDACICVSTLRVCSIVMNYVHMCSCTGFLHALWCGIKHKWILQFCGLICLLLCGLWECTLKARSPVLNLRMRWSVSAMCIYCVFGIDWIKLTRCQSNLCWVKSIDFELLFAQNNWPKGRSFWPVGAP